MKTNKFLPWILLGVVIILSIFREGCNQKKLEKLNAEISTYELQNQTLQDSLTNKEGQVIQLQQAVVFEGERGKEALSRFADSVFALRKKDAKKYKETVAYYENYIRTHIPDTLYVPIDTSSNYIGADTLEYLANSIRVPLKFERRSLYFGIKGEVQKSNVRIDSLNLPDTIRGRFIEKKGKWFKPNTIEYQVFNTNPYINIDNSKSAIYQQRKKPLKFITPLVIGIIAGILITK
jgi:hypothetical protein